VNHPVIDIYDTSVSVWEDAVDEASFRRRIFDPLIRFLRGRSWKVGQDPKIVKHYRSLRKWRRLASKGELCATLELTGRVIKLEMWQERYNVENPNGGRYDHQKRRRMPPMLRRRCDLETIRAVDFLKGVTGYPVADRRYLSETADERIARDIRESGHCRPALGRAEFHSDSNRRSGDGGLIEHGQSCWCRDRKGRILRGVAYYRLNNGWWMRLSKDSAIATWAHEIYLRQPQNVRVRRNDDLRASRLRSELKAAIEAEDFRRAHLLKVLRDAATAKVEQARKREAA
jgi:hypothetical protein